MALGASWIVPFGLLASYSAMAALARLGTLAYLEVQYLLFIGTGFVFGLPWELASDYDKPDYLGLLGLTRAVLTMYNDACFHSVLGS